MQKQLPEKVPPASSSSRSKSKLSEVFCVPSASSAGPSRASSAAAPSRASSAAPPGASSASTPSYASSAGPSVAVPPVDDEDSALATSGSPTQANTNEAVRTTLTQGGNSVLANPSQGISSVPATPNRDAPTIGKGQGKKGSSAFLRGSATQQQIWKSQHSIESLESFLADNSVYSIFFGGKFIILNFFFIPLQDDLSIAEQQEYIDQISLLHSKLIHLEEALKIEEQEAKLMENLEIHRMKSIQDANFKAQKEKERMVEEINVQKEELERKKLVKKMVVESDKALVPITNVVVNLEGI